MSESTSPETRYQSPPGTVLRSPSLEPRPSETPLRVVVLTSGEGTLLQSMIDGLDDRVSLVAVGADRQCRALDRAQEAGFDTFLEEFNPHRLPNYDRDAWNARFAMALKSWQPDLVVSAGFMRILGTGVISSFPGRIINTHPALLPAFPGAHAVEDALDYGVALTGSTVHLVDDGVDTGPIIAQRPVPVLRGDTRATLHERIKAVERQLIVDVLHRAARYGYTIDGRKVWIND